jgi:hypothetical protein
VAVSLFPKSRQPVLGGVEVGVGGRGRDQPQLLSGTQRPEWELHALPVGGEDPAPCPTQPAARGSPHNNGGGAVAEGWGEAEPALPPAGTSRLQEVSVSGLP